jgi:hypothetical protein
MKLSDYPGVTFALHWVNVGDGEWGPTAALRGGSIIPIARPDNTTH